MYNLIEKIKEIDAFNVFDGSVFIKTENKLLKYGFNYCLDKDIVGIELISDQLIILELDYNDNKIICDFELNVISELNSGLSAFRNFYKKKYLITSEFNGELILRLYSLEDRKNLWEYSLPGYDFKSIIYNDYLYIIGHSYVKKIDIGSSNLMWSCEELLKIQEFPKLKLLGFFNNLLIVRSNEVLILGIDIETGKELFRHNSNREIVEMTSSQLDAENGKVFSISSGKYYELDLNTLNDEILDIREQSKVHQVNTVRLGSWEGDLIYFWEGITNSRVGVFDRKSHNIIWSYDFDECDKKFPAIRDVKHTGDKLCVQDHFYNLHIFEKNLC